MRTRTRLVVAGLAVVVVGGYAVADAADVVPGVLTTVPPWPEAEPFPTVTLPAEPVRPLVLPDLDPDAPIPDPAALEPGVAALRGDDAVGSPPGVVVADVATGEVLVSADAETGRAPASTLKLLTATAAVSALDLSSRIPTTLVQDGADHLVLVGHGDMALAAGAGDPDATIGRAGLADLAAEAASVLQAAGTTSVSLAVDDSLFTGPEYAPGWEPVDFTQGWVAPVSALAVEVGHIDGRLQRDTDPAMGAANAFAAALEDAGVEVRGAPVRGRAGDGVQEVARVESATIRELVEHTLQLSDNTLSEVLGRLVALEHGQEASFEGATRAIIAELAATGLDTGGTVLVDCSGLSSRSRVAPRLLSDLVLAITRPDTPGLLAAASAMPIAGLEGTLADRYSSEAAGLVRAKTGTLAVVVSLAGNVVTADGRQLAFVVMADGVPRAGTFAARVAIDEWVSSLAACGCT
ncbi:D-alanyl-D-alaninecarboxypeptidase/D-alanyl-D-al anine-endopeptidase [Beutenbergia cavernae DSM 12333]|uniref:D-alanyl-D-alaninecarboxypeptidase/D-alanyl-D-al anine-endopeptidase n=1 Tax=Beutenbergia cavernae (strain ATCC BAA-8 / DSM 12333 / CCUG 43141 / JCM 11478 / NBRC 16432 / NCIMB 13614 / HKI 0122) TaxID=471853 RepID=C5BYK0_BEUC1|nr:D-alanyl-D-alanine carboxypeptidase/D-alanyl-D-alanine-endopeptidase [Beutenbergia cavernae]ACQ78958.1 D-alanyl-D-alaninecarboxypeptidase/D-alanyl-D-al anine-endopeptidase [Beutenbergia cavernae DSM 12333]